MTSINRRTLLGSMAATALLSSTGLHAQTPYPSRPVRLIVGFPAGTGPDMVARVLAQKLSEGWGNVGMVVDNRTGAGGTIAASAVARAAPDGYTLLLGETGTLAIAPSIFNRLPYDPARDFAPVSQVVSTDFVLLVNPERVPARNVRDFAAWTQQQQRLLMATFGAGTPGHFGAFMFGEAVGQNPEIVHYRSTGDALRALFNGDVHGVFASVGLAAPQVRSGRLIALGSTGATRTNALPDVPTIKEQGYENLVFGSWFGVVAPVNTPADILARLTTDVQRAVTSADGRARLEEAGFRVTGTSQQDFARIIASDTATWAKAVAATGFKADL